MAFVDGPVAVGNLVEGQREVEDLAGIDRAVGAELERLDALGRALLFADDRMKEPLGASTVVADVVAPQRARKAERAALPHER